MYASVSICENAFKHSPCRAISREPGLEGDRRCETALVKRNSHKDFYLWLDFQRVETRARGGR